jgi:alkanesulfonate monooxygenase SsuD/methylene tetrahydromethanopterin reductase-like flavin-dependent oxidoreductase (luciferase family)
MLDLEFGVFLNPEVSDYSSLLGDALLCEDLGFGSVWISDHLVGMYNDPGAARFECWTTSTALLVDTTSVKVGQLVMANPFRPPPLMAKMGATLDSISGGRLILGLGTGWHEGEFKAYGYPFESPRDRVKRLDEAAIIIKRMWTETSPSFQGEFYSIEDAYCDPKPVQDPHPPLMLAGGGEELTLKTVARHADISNFAAWMGSTEDFEHKAKVLEEWCTRVGRDFSDITKSWAAYIIIGEDEERVEGKISEYRRRMQSRYGDPSRERTPPLAGTPEELAEQMESYMEVGCGMFILRFMGGDLEKEATLFAEEVIPVFN